MKINWKVRFKNPLFVAQLGMSILVPILAYAGLTVQDLTTWKALGDLLLGAFSNPYVLGLVAISVYNAVLDPTTRGLNDSLNVLNREVK
ncbi:holin [Romboutsia ilealis]|jgi:phi LC3 family holin|uniref:Holin n=1 Tax=Romboutsia faecis TaxID=2764597 RepID=A0ABR7JPV2_9FIRM|nr:phage holin [Romboutsia faecis]MBC5996946.1 holin [Romboutsia faecis]MRN24552.1 holin [Romboutsia ilealis]